MDSDFSMQKRVIHFIFIQQKRKKPINLFRKKSTVKAQALLYTSLNFLQAYYFSIRAKTTKMFVILYCLYILHVLLLNQLLILDLVKIEKKMSLCRVLNFFVFAHQYIFIWGRQHWR